MQVGTPTIYKKNIYPGAIRVTMFGALVVSMLLFLGDVRLAIVALLIPGGMIAIQLWMETRKAVIFSPEEIRFDLGTPSNFTVIRGADIVRVEETRTTENFGQYPCRVPGVRLVLRSGEEKVLPLDFPARQEILIRLRAMLRQPDNS